MNLKEAKLKYSGKINDDCWNHYEDADKYCYINEGDPDLQKFRIDLPEPPDWGNIKNFGKHPYHQVYTPSVYPERLMQLERTVRNRELTSRSKSDSRFSFEINIHENFLKELERKSDQYKEEINWIREQWYYRLRGQWQFIKGKPVYIDGWMYMYLNWFPLEGVRARGGLPEYRDRDRKWFHAQRYAYTTTLAPDRDKFGRLITLSDGTLKMKDMGSRTAYGTNNMKGRRVGDTSKTQCILLCEATENKEVYNGIQGNTESTAGGIYREKLLFAFRKFPLFFRPQMPDFHIATELKFDSPEFVGGLGSKVDFATTAKRHYYDSKKLTMIHTDEIGKTVNEDIDRRHEVLKRCVATGVKINGMIIATSTCDDMEAKSAKKFLKLTKASHFEDRGRNGQTKSGLLNIYFNITSSYEGYIDRWGFGVEDNPDLDQVPYLHSIYRNDEGEIMGCREYLLSIEEKYKNDGDLMRLAEHRRMNPMSFKDVFANTGGNMFFNLEKCRTRFSYLNFRTEDPIRRGNFIWLSGFGSKVSFIDDENGRFLVSMLPSKDLMSLTINDAGIRRPAYRDVFVASADAFRLEKTDSYRMSYGSGAVLYKHDPRIDSEDIPVIDWETNRFVCTYLARPDTLDEYCEDMLKMCVAYGALMYPENNINAVNEFFIRKNYQGYLLHDIFPDTGKVKKNAGWSTAGSTIKQKMFNICADWINLHVHRCDHPEIIEEFLNIDSPDAMKDYDLFVSLAGCLMGQESSYVDYIRTFSNVKCDVSGWW